MKQRGTAFESVKRSMVR